VWCLTNGKKIMQMERFTGKFESGNKYGDNLALLAEHSDWSITMSLFTTALSCSSRMIIRISDHSLRLKNPTPIHTVREERYDFLDLSFIWFSITRRTL
jgi:hypothetical protein